MFTFALTPAVIFELYSNSFEYRGINNWRNWNLDPLFAWHGDARGSARRGLLMPTDWSQPRTRGQEACSPEGCASDMAGLSNIPRIVEAYQFVVPPRV